MIDTPPPGSATVRVAHLSPTYFSDSSVIGGGERYVFNLAAALAKADRDQRFEQAIFALGTSEGLLVHDGIPVRLLRNENPSSNPMDAISTALWREAASFDLLHVHQSLAVFGAHACVLARSLGKTLVVTDLGGGELGVMTAGKGLQLADGVVSISAYAESLIAGDLSGPSEVLIGPVDTDAFAPPATPFGGPPLALCVSRILSHKGIHRVIAALPAGLALRVVGRVYDQSYHAHLQALAAGKSVEFIHDADDARLIELYGTATAFVQASTMSGHDGRIYSRPELMGLAPLEAMSSGLPAILSNAGSLPELAVDPSFCRTFASDAELAAALREVAAGSWPAAGAGGRARRHVVEQHGYAAIGERLARFYTRVHRRRAPGQAA